MIRRPPLRALISLLVLLLIVYGATAQELQAELAAASGGCVAGGIYDPACDVNRDNTINIVDIELTATHWGQAGTWTSGGAVDGVILIDQMRALNGDVTPGDAPGFPVTVSEPGSYRLASNLVIPDENTTAIEITASDVTLDLNGFAILGPVVCSGDPLVCTPNSTGAGYGIVSPVPPIPFPSSIAVRNGTVRGMGQDGIWLVGEGHLIEHMRVESNRFTGIFGMVHRPPKWG